MKRIRRADVRVYRLDAALPPILHVEPGEEFAVETEDASSGLLAEHEMLPTAENLPYLRHDPVQSNPMAGPIFVAGVRAGQRLKVEIVDITVAPAGATRSRPAMSPLGDSRTWPELGEPFMVRVHHRDGQAVISDRMHWDLSPMIGTLACAPEWEAHGSAPGQGPWGGNLDVRDVRRGASVYLNAYHDSGLLFIGDVHGCQGDGEYAGAADETRAEVVVRAAPAAGAPLPYPRVETDDRIIALYVDKPLEAAAHGAVQHLMRWLVEDFGFSRREAYLMVALNPAFHIHVYQMTAIHGLSYTVGASLPQKEVR